MVFYSDDNKFTGKGINYLIRNKWDCLEELDLCIKILYK